MFNIENFMTILNKFKNKKFCRYVFFAGISTFVNMLVFYILYHFLKLDIVMSNFISYVLSTATSFMLNKKFVYKSKNKYLQESIKFVIVKIISFSLDTIILITLHRFLKIIDIIAKILSNASTGILNYKLNKIFVFKEKIIEETTK